MSGGDAPAAEGLYRALLRLYPKAFRAAYGRHMRLTFRDACRAAYRQGGRRGLLALWLPTLLDLFKSALAAHLQEMTMSKPRLIAWAGPLTMAVGALWLLVAAGEVVFRTVLKGQDAFLAFTIIPFILSFVPLLFALVGTLLRFYPRAGVVGKLGLALSLTGCAGVVLSLLANSLGGGAAAAAGRVSWMNYATVAGIVSVRLGYLLFGVDALRFRLLPRLNGLPLLLGLTVVLSLPFEWFGVPALLPLPWVSPPLHFAVSGACWLLLGVVMWGHGRRWQAAAA